MELTEDLVLNFQTPLSQEMFVEYVLVASLHRVSCGVSKIELDITKLKYFFGCSGVSLLFLVIVELLF